MAACDVDSAHVITLALLALLSAPPESEPPPTTPAEVSAPEQEPEPIAPAPTGGFGRVESVTIVSNVHALPPTELDPNQASEEQGPRRELSARVEAGYAQTSLANAEGLDHHGLFLRLHLVFYPWVTKQRRVAGGIGALYSYAGVNRWKLPETAQLDASKAQQQQVLLSLNLLVRPHPTWFSIQPSAMIGLGFYTNAKVFAADRSATIRKDEYAFVAGGSLALCTAWDIVCAVGGSEILIAIETVGTQEPLTDSLVINPYGWHVGVGVDILRIMDRANQGPA